MTQTLNPLPPVTIVIEWENAIDTEDKWAALAMSSLERELADVGPRMSQKPWVMYLYDEGQVQAETIRKVIAQAAPRLPELAELELMPTPGLTYYKLKNYGIARSRTGISVMLDSDAGPQPGWLEGLLMPFADPEVMAVGGFTVMGHDDLVSKTMALSWIFDLPEERTKTQKRQKIHANNCAVRTDFFRANPFPDLQSFKKQCGFWLRDFSARGIKYVRTPDAMTVHAPHPGLKFLAWRAWVGGHDADFLAFHTRTKSRIGRLLDAPVYFGRKTAKGWKKIIRKGKSVDLPVWQRPAAMLIVLGFYGVTFVSQLVSAATRSFEPLPRVQDSPLLEVTA